MHRTAPMARRFAVSAGVGFLARAAAPAAVPRVIMSEQSRGRTVTHVNNSAERPVRAMSTSASVEQPAKQTVTIEITKKSENQVRFHTALGQVQVAGFDWDVAAAYHMPALRLRRPPAAPEEHPVACTRNHCTYPTVSGRVHPLVPPACSVEPCAEASALGHSTYPLKQTFAPDPSSTTT